MRCSCKVCGPEIWMVQADSDRLGCVCTVCGYRCSDCLGTDTVVPREALRSLSADPRFSPERLQALFDAPEEAWDDAWEETEADDPVSDRERYGGY